MDVINPTVPINFIAGGAGGAAASGGGNSGQSGSSGPAINSGTLWYWASKKGRLARIGCVDNPLKLPLTALRCR